MGEASKRRTIVASAKRAWRYRRSVSINVSDAIDIAGRMKRYVSEIELGRAAVDSIGSEPRYKKIRVAADPIHLEDEPATSLISITL